MGKTPEIGTALHDIAAAIREHTEHVKTDDQRYWDEKNEDAKAEGDADHKTYQELVDETSEGVFNRLDVPRGKMTARRAGRSRSIQQAIDDSVIFPENCQLLMQEILHQYKAISGGYIRGLNKRCQICGLTYGNPVHQIKLKSDDDF